MPTGTRAYWKGYLRLSLVTIGVEIYAATDSAKATAFHQIHKPSGKRVRYEKVAPGVGAVKASDIVKGFEIGDDSYVVVEPEELDAIKLESKRAIDFVQFVDPDEIDPRYFDKPYYIAPEGEVSTEALVVLREALRASNKTGLAKLTMRGRENLVAIMPLGDGLLLETLHYANEIRSAATYFDELKDAKIDKEMVSLAMELIERKTKKFDASEFRDAYAVALDELVARKRAGHAIIRAPEEERPLGKVINLIEALRESVGAERGRRKETPERAPTRRDSPGKRASSAKARPARRRA
jgi:DNA end-binding protein Ku